MGGADDGGPHDEGQDRVLRRDQGSQEGRASRWSPRRSPSGAQQTAKAADDLVKMLTRETILDSGQRLDGRGFDEIRPDHLRGRPAPAHARLRALHPRRDAGARDGDARHLRRRADHRGVRGRVRAHVPPPLQLPAVLRRRGEVPPRPVAPRHRPRQPRAARALAGPARRGGVPLHGPRRLRHPRVERLLVDGHRLRRHARAHGRRRADQGARRGRRDGPRQRRRPLRRSSPTSPARKTTTATWTSRSPARARASPPSRWTSRSRGSAARSSSRRSSRRARGRLDILDKMARPSTSRARTSRPTRRASSRCRSRATGSATSSARGGKTIRAIIESTGCKIDVEDSGKRLHRVLRRGRGAARDRDHREPHAGARDRQGLPAARCGASSRTEPSSRSCRARTAWSTSPSSRPTACARRPTSSRKATRSRSRSSPSTRRARSSSPASRRCSKEELEAEMAMAPVGAAGEDEGRGEFPRGGRGPGEHRGHPNRDNRGAAGGSGGRH